jgi:hypothetical protein
VTAAWRQRRFLHISQHSTAEEMWFCQLNCSPNARGDNFNISVIGQVVGVHEGVTEGVVILQHNPATTVLM